MQQLERIIRMVVCAQWALTLPPAIRSNHPIPRMNFTKWKFHLNIMRTPIPEMANPEPWSEWPQNAHKIFQINAPHRQRSRITFAFYILIIKFHSHQFGWLFLSSFLPRHFHTFHSLFFTSICFHNFFFFLFVSLHLFALALFCFLDFGFVCTLRILAERREHTRNRNNKSRRKLSNAQKDEQFSFLFFFPLLLADSICAFIV